MKKRLWQVARDTHGEGVGLIDLLVELNLAQDHHAAKELIKKGKVAVYRTVIKDVLYKLTAGSYIIALSKKPQVRVTIL